jgi:hypothetical protein
MDIATIIFVTTFSFLATVVIAAVIYAQCCLETGSEEIIID